MTARTLIPDPDDYLDAPAGDAALIERHNQRDLRETGEREIANTPGGIDPLPQPEMQAGDASGTGFGKARKMALDAILAAQTPRQETVDDADTKAPAPKPYSEDFRPIAEMNIADSPGGIDLAPSRALIPPHRAQIDTASPMTFPPMDVTADPPTVTVRKPTGDGGTAAFIARSQGARPAPTESTGARGDVLKSILGAGIRPEVAQYLAQKQGVGGDTGNDDELANAQRIAQLTGAVSMIGRAANTMGAGLSHRPADQSFYDTLDRQAQQPVANIMQQRQEQDRRAKASLDTARAQAENTKLASEAALSDPNSPETARARQFAKGIFASVGKSNPQALAAFDGMTGAEIAKNVPVVQKLLDDDANRQSKHEDSLERDKDRALTRQMAWTQHQDNMQMHRDQFADKLDETRKQHADKDVQGIEKAVGEDASNFASNAHTVDEILKKYPRDGDLPGVGTVTGHMPDFGISDDGLALRQGLGQMLASYRHKITGSGMSNQERAELDSIAGIAKTGTDRQIRQAVGRLEQLQRNNLTRIYAGYDPAAVAEYAKRNPLLAVGGNQTATATAPTGALPQGARTFYSAKRNQTKIVYPDGHEEIVNGQR